MPLLGATEVEDTLFSREFAEGGGGPLFCITRAGSTGVIELDFAF